MAHLQETEPRRRADGSIDSSFYIARAEAIRRRDLKRLGKRLLGFLAACAGLLWALQSRKSQV
jgi:hypothetical protein